MKRWLIMGLAPLVLGGCVSTEPVYSPPSINLSPETMDFVADGGAADTQRDFGLTTTVNESDSLTNLEVLPGLRVQEVRPASAADDAGIEAGDIILSVNGVKTNQPDSLSAVLQESKQGPYVIRARRGTTVYDTDMQRPVTRPVSEPKARYRSDPLKTRAGYQTRLVETGADGQTTVATIVDFQPQSPLPAADFAEGDAIVAIDGQHIESAQDLVDKLTRDYDFGDKISLEVIPIDTAQSVRREVRLWAPPRRLSRLQLWPLFRYESSVNPSQTEFVILDFFIVSLFRYQRQEGEKQYSLLSLFTFASDYGELVETTANDSDNE